MVGEGGTCCPPATPQPLRRGDVHGRRRHDRRYAGQRPARRHAGDDVIAGLGGTTGSPASTGTTCSLRRHRRRPADVVRPGTRRCSWPGPGDDFVGSFENPHARGPDGQRGTTTPPPGSATTRAGRSTAVPAATNLFLSLTLAVHEAGPMRGQLELREGLLVRRSRGGGEVGGDGRAPTARPAAEDQALDAGPACTRNAAPSPAPSPTGRSSTSPPACAGTSVAPTRTSSSSSRASSVRIAQERETTRSSGRRSPR